MTEPGTFKEASGITLSQDVYITWTPQDDITAYELARCIGLTNHPFMTSAYIPSGCERHFTVWRQEK